MSRILYVDCFSGAAGDMLLGALLDAGLPVELLREAVRPMALDVDVEAAHVVRGGIRATKFRVVGPDGTDPSDADGTHAHRHLPAIVKTIERAGVSDAVRKRSVALVTRLAEVEAAIHGIPVERVHLHEVGAVDSIVDLVGAAAAFEWFAPARVVCSPLNVGSGTVRTAHGVLPVPAPATAKLLEGVPVYADGPPMECVTPTGALLLTAYADSFGAMPPMKIVRTAYGAGDREVAGRPNVVRVIVGEASAAAADGEEQVVVIECEVDDVSPQVVGAVMDLALARGALDVFFTSVVMKKNRPGILITILAQPHDRDRLVELVFREVPTLGVRYHETRRQRLAREHTTVDTGFGPVRVKVARRRGVVTNAAPEFDDCARLAAEQGVPVRDVMAAAVHAWRSLTPASSPE